MGYRQTETFAVNLNSPVDCPRTAKRLPMIHRIIKNGMKLGVRIVMSASSASPLKVSVLRY
jgi:hypothetical protein